VRSGLLQLEQLRDVPLFEDFRQQVLGQHPQLQGRRLLYESIRRMLSAQVYDVIDATRAALEDAQPVDADAARRCPSLVRFSEAMRDQSTALKRFLFANLYRHAQVIDTTQQAQQVVRELFAVYLESPAEMQTGFATRAQHGGDAAARAVADYIAGMTDRFAAREHERLTGQRLWLVQAGTVDRAVE
jgi:dGTPase